MINVVATNDATHSAKEYIIDECLWNEIIVHYIDLQQNHAQIGKCYKIINDNLIKRSSKLIADGRVIDRLTELNKLFVYLCDASNECVLQMLEAVSTDAIASSFLQHMQENAFKRTNIVDFLGEYYKADFKSSALTAEVWTKMRPISDEGKTRGYSGPAELPLLLLAGGYKADKGDIIINSNLIEIKGDGGRIGESSKWISNRVDVERFINQFAKDRPTISALQLEFQFTDASKIFEMPYDFSMLPYSIACMARAACNENLINCKDDAVHFLGAVQLLEYICSKKDDWFVLLKHPGKKTAPFGTAFIINNACIEYNACSCIKLFKEMQSCDVTFSACYDSGGYKIKFAK
jgi:hypothetical protein